MQELYHQQMSHFHRSLNEEESATENKFKSQSQRQFTAIDEYNSSKEQSANGVNRKPPIPTINRAAKTVRQYEREFNNTFLGQKPDYDSQMIT